MGTAASPYDEWIELYNTTDQDIDLTGWTLIATDGAPNIVLSGLIPAHGYFLLERSDEGTVSDIAADQIYTGSLDNTGEALFLRDPAGALIDTANGDGGPWPAGDNTTKRTMERIDPLAADSDTNWATNDGLKRNGLDADGNPIDGTPKAQNSVTNFLPTADFAFTPETPTTWDPVEFQDLSSDLDGTIVAWLWDFGDGQTSSERNPTHRYQSPGSYAVTLEVTDNGGRSSSVTKVVEVSLGPGDVDGNGTINVLDVRLCYQIAVGAIAGTPEQREQADVDQDGDVDEIDARILAEYVIGLQGNPP